MPWTDKKTKGGQPEDPYEAPVSHGGSGATEAHTPNARLFLEPLGFLVAPSSRSKASPANRSIMVVPTPSSSLDFHNLPH